MTTRLLMMLLAGLALAAPLTAQPAEDPKPEGRLIFSEDFEDYPDGAMPEGWWAEGPEYVGVEQGRLRIKSDPPIPGRGVGDNCSMFHRQKFSGDLRIRFDAHITSSSIASHNINFFLFYSHPNGQPLEASREERALGSYPLYHDLNGYIFTFVNHKKTDDGRFRIRRCPGFELLDEAFTYHCRVGQTYQVELTRRGHELSIAVDGRHMLTATDEKPIWQEGLLGLRTYRCDMWWDNIKVWQLD